MLPALVQTYAEVRSLFHVSRQSFMPRPKVESSVVEVRWSAADAKFMEAYATDLVGMFKPDVLLTVTPSITAYTNNCFKIVSFCRKSAL